MNNLLDYKPLFFLICFSVFFSSPSYSYAGGPSCNNRCSVGFATAVTTIFLGFITGTILSFRLQQKQYICCSKSECGYFQDQESLSLACCPQDRQANLSESTCTPKNRLDLSDCNMNKTRVCLEQNGSVSNSSRPEIVQTRENAQAIILSIMSGITFFAASGIWALIIDDFLHKHRESVVEPVETVEAVEAVPITITTSEASNLPSCQICFDALQKFPQCLTPCCEQNIHVNCLNTWAKRENPACPFCRHEL